MAKAAKTIVAERQNTRPSQRPAAAHASGLDMISQLPAPRQQFIEAIDGMSVDHSLQDVLQVCVGLDFVQLAGRDQRADHRPAMSATIAAGEQVVLAAEGDGADGALDRIGVELDAAIVQEASQAVPARECIADRFSERAAAGDQAELRIEPDVQRVDDRFGEGPAFGKTVVRRLAADARLDRIELADPAQGFCCHGRRGGFGHIVELASRVAPTRRERDALFVGQLLEASVSVDMQVALEGGKMCDCSLGLAVGCEQVDGGRRFGSAPRPLLARVHPKPSRLGSSAARIEYRDRRVIGKEMVGGEHVLAQPFVQGLEPPACAANPARERRAAEIDAVTVEDLRLPIERKMIAVFADQHVREQRRRRKTASDQSLWRAGLHHLVAGAAGVFRTGRTQDAKLRRDPIQHLADALADQMESTATAAADPVLYVKQNVFVADDRAAHDDAAEIWVPV